MTGKNIFKKLRLKRIEILILLFFLCLGLISPLPIEAGLEWLPTKIGNYLLSLIFKILIIISGVFLSLSSWFLSWVISPSFIGVKFTDNPFVTPAWGVVRDFANMGFVLALVTIGLGTALRIESYRMQKTLPWLVIMALCINFTPVICGIFIDVSSIIMNFFLEGVSFDWAVRTWRGMTISLANSVPTEGFWELFGMGIGMVSFNIIAGIVFFIFAFLFAVRYVALWALVILSPLAFFAYVLPATRGYWKMWWNQFLQWCFIGVIAAFWIYLGHQLMIVSGEIAGAPPPEPEFEGLSALAGYMVPIIFLGIGLIQSTVSAAGGANLVIKAAKITGAVGVAAGKKAAIGGKVWAREKAPPHIRERFSELAKIKTPFQVTKEEQEMGPRAWPKRALKWAARAPVGPIYVGLRRLGETALPETELKEMEKAKEEAKKFKTPEGRSKYFLGAPSRAGRLGSVLAALEEGEDLIEDLGFSKEEVIKAGREAAAVGGPAFAPIMKAYPSLVEEMLKLASEETKRRLSLDRKTIKEWVGKNEDKIKAAFNVTEITDALIGEQLPKLRQMKVTTELKPDDYKKVKFDYMDWDAMHLFSSGREIGAAARHFGAKFGDRYMGGTHIRGSEWYEKHNPKPLRYLRTAAAQELGFGRPLKLGEVVTLPSPGASRQERLTSIEPEIARSDATINKLERIPEAERTDEEKTMLRGHRERLKILEKQRDQLRAVAAPPGAPPAAPPRGRPGVAPGKPPRGRPGVGRRP